MNISCDLPILKGDNYKVWKEMILLHLGWMDMDYAIRKDEPPAIIETSEPDVVTFMKGGRDLIISLLCS